MKILFRLFPLILSLLWVALLPAQEAAIVRDAGSPGSPPETSKFDGDWQGELTFSNGEKSGIRIVVENGAFTQYFADGSGWREVSPKVSYFETLNDILLVGWLNQGGVWTENQMYSLTWVNSSTLEVAWTRHVTNRSGGDDGSSWNARAEGVLKKQ